jgi:hypothetical protein
MLPKRSTSPRTRKNPLWWRLYASRRGKAVLLGIAALPLFQVGCYPDFPAAISFQLQTLVNTMVISAANIIIQNILGL